MTYHHTKINWAAVRAYRRAAGPIIQASGEAEEADAGFDGGEWSGPAHATMLEERLVELERRVAARFNLTRRELMYMCLDADYEEQRRFQDAHINREQGVRA